MTVLAVKYVFVILHIITAAGWFGLAMRLPSQARLTLVVDRPALAALATETSRSVRLMSVFLVLTLLFSLAAFFLGGGFAVYGPPYHTSLLLIVLFLLVQFVMIQASWKKLAASATLPERPPANELAKLRKRLAAGVGIGHLLWLILIVLMFWNVLVATF